MTELLWGSLADIIFFNGKAGKSIDLPLLNIHPTPPRQPKMLQK